MPASLRPLTTGQLLDRTFQSYRQNFILFAGISAVPNGCVLVLQLAVLALTKSNAGNPMLAVIATALFGLGIIIVNLIVSAISTAATTFAVSDIYLDQSTSISSCFGRVRGKIGRVVYTSIEFALRVGVGFILLIVPGVYWAGKYGLAVPAVVLEDIKARKAFPRSAELTKDAVGRIIAIYFLTWILMMVVAIGMGFVIQAVAPALAKTAGTITAETFNLVVSSLIATLITPVMSIALTLAYYDQRVRKEAFDIENLMSLLGEPGTQASAQSAGTTS
jgi:glycerophosphoryl diester phosphodiesterase family protein